MLHPKVPAHQRQRVTEACNICRQNKKRCSGSAPCTQCQHRGLEPRCFMTYAPRGSRANARAEAAQRAAPTTTASSRSQDVPGRLLSPARELVNGSCQWSSVTGTNSFQPVSPSESRHGDDDDSRNTNSAVEASSTNNPARMLLNLRAERVYIGGAASISFLHVIRRLVSQQIGPSPFSHNDKNDRMLEMESPQAVMTSELEMDDTRLTAEQKQNYLRCYYAVTEALIYVFDPLEVESLLVSTEDMDDMSNKQDMPPLKRAAVGLVLSIGAQCESSSAAKTVGQACFRKAQRDAFAGFLEDPDLDLVRAFLLMAFYMLGECRRNAAFMYLGIAVRAALALGLHSRDSYANNPGPADQLRLRVWMSVCILDKLVNSILGRPATTVGIPTGDRAFIAEIIQPGDHAADCLVSAYSILSLVNDATSEIYDKMKISMALVEQLLQEIELWKHDLPQSARKPATDDQMGINSSPTQTGTVGKVHVSCLYYFAVILVTRPFLISSLAAPKSRPAPHSHLAAACLDAAMYLAQTCVEAHNAGMLRGNMCIMKALIFAAGLVLGFEIFAKTSVEHEIETAFHGASDVLRYLSTQSPQAKHYLDILTSLSNAIARRHSSQSFAGRSRYVSRIFSLSSSTDTEKPSYEDDSIWHIRDGDEAVMGLSLPPLEGNELGLDWDSLDISQWDSFPALS